MGRTTIRSDEDVCERLRENERDDETFSEAVERMEPAVEEYGKRGM